MDPLTLSLLVNGGSSVLSGLFGAMQSRKAAAQQRAYRANIMRVADPNYLRTLTQSLYSQALTNPAFAAARRGIFNAGSNITNRLSGSLAARGLSGSGVGAIAPALAGSSTAGQLGQLRTNTYNMAGQEAGQQQNTLLRSLQDMGPEQNFNYGSQAVGGGVADIGRWLLDYYGAKKKAATVAP